jgi:hypothetical protein
LEQPGVEAEVGEPVATDLDLPGTPSAEEARVVVEDSAPEALVPEAAEAPGPRDLVVRVVGPDGALVNGVPLSLERAVEGGRSQGGRQSLRLSGFLDTGDFDDGEDPTPGVDGMATWLASERPLDRNWKHFDEGRLDALWLRVGVPGAAPLDRRLEFAAWPTEIVELYVDAAVVAHVAPVAVQVFRADGSPAVDVPVFLGLEALDPEFGHAIGLEDYQPDAAKVPHTDTEGRALLPVQSFLQFSTMFGRDEVLFDPYVGIALPMSDPPHEEVELGRGEVIRVDLPELGRLEARLVDAEGRLLDFTGQEYGIRYQVRWSAASGVRGRPQKGKLYGETLENPIDLGLCGPGVTLDAWAADLSRPYPMGEWEGKGPSRAGELVVLEFDMGMPRPETRFVVVDASGTPLAETDVNILIREMKPEHEYQYPTERTWSPRHTDREGAFMVDGNSWSDPSVLEVEVEGEPAWAQLELPREVTAVWRAAGDALGDRATLDGGTLRLSPKALPPLPVWVKPIVASGIVVDSAGLPVEEARVDARRFGGTNQVVGWTRSSADGRFEIVEESDRSFYLTVSAKGCKYLETGEYTYGTRDLVLTLERRPEPGSLYGRLMNVPETTHDHLELRAGRKGWGASAVPDAEGRFEFEELWSGKVSFVVESKVLGLELASFDDGEVVAHERRTDPRIEELDMASHVKLRSFTFETSAGEKLGSLSARIGPPNGFAPDFRVGPRGTCELFVPATWTRVRIFVPGYEPVEASLDTPEVLVRLQPR